MNADHAALAAELRALAVAALDRLEPILERAVRAAEEAGDPGSAAAPDTGPTAAPDPGAPSAGADGRSACAWCPVCALVALARGEQHELLTLLASQLAALLALVRALLAEHGGHTAPEPAAPPSGDVAARARTFEPIRVHIEDNPNP